MTESKNIVIKVKYAASEPPLESHATHPKMVTEWNVKRIAGALTVFTIVSLGAYCGLSKDNGSEATPNAALSETPPIVAQMPNPAPQSPLKPATGISAEKTIAQEPFPRNHADKTPAPVSKAAAENGPQKTAAARIRRSALAFRIIDKEPAGMIDSVVKIRGGNTLPVYYFTEIRGEPKQILYHEWLKEGHVVFRHPVPVAAERWRTSSQRQIGLDDTGNWSVRTTSDEGAVMNEIRFSVIPE